MQYATLYTFVQDALRKPLPGSRAQRLMAPSTRNPQNVMHRNVPRLSAVCLLLFPENGQWYIPLIKRNVYKGQHSAQISFPGGKQEEIDLDLKATALRETAEEIGVKVKEEDVLGRLSCLNIPISNFNVHPYMACCDKTPIFDLNTNEVQYIIKYPIEHLFSEDYKDKISIESQGQVIQAPIYRVGDDYIWGATAMILSEFEQLLKPLYL